MSQVKTFHIGDKSYNVQRASAVQQDELLSVLSQPIIARLASAGAPDIDDVVLVTMFAAMEYSMKKRVDALLLSNVVIPDTNQKVTAHDFQNRVMELSTLRAEVLRWNLEDFFTFWANEFTRQSEQIKTSTQSETV